MPSPSSLLICTAAFSGVPTFVLSCDDDALRWLSDSFRGLDKAQSFAIGDGEPIGSDGKCVIEVFGDPLASEAEITSSGPGRFAWHLSLSQARQYAYLISGIEEFMGSSHQYLESKEMKTPILMVSKGEYELETLRDMRDEVNSGP